MRKEQSKPIIKAIKIILESEPEGVAFDDLIKRVAVINFGDWRINGTLSTMVVLGFVEKRLVPFTKQYLYHLNKEKVDADSTEWERFIEGTRVDTARKTQQKLEALYLQRSPTEQK